MVKYTMKELNNSDTERVSVTCCGNCFFWMQLPGSSEGTCHFAPPTPMIVGMSAAGNGKLQGIPQAAPQPIVGAQFPPTKVTTWCGCWRPVAQEQED